MTHIISAVQIYQNIQQPAGDTRLNHDDQLSWKWAPIFYESCGSKIRSGTRLKLYYSVRLTITMLKSFWNDQQATHYPNHPELILISFYFVFNQHSIIWMWVVSTSPISSSSGQVLSQEQSFPIRPCRPHTSAPYYSASKYSVSAVLANGW